MAARKASRKKAGAKARSKSSKGKKKGTWGGRRPGAGRPKGSGQGPSPNSRRNRVAVMLTDTELKTLRATARKQGIPVSTAAYQYIAKNLGKRA
jgi:DNA invertase Pin-like site-specific DNA recombinase